MATKIQNWWRGILQERECLRQKLIAARQALNEHKLRLLEAKTSPGKVEGTEKKAGNVDVMQTACFGRFEVLSDVLKSEEKNERKKEVDEDEDEKEEVKEELDSDVSDILNACSGNTTKENKLKQLSEMLKSNPDLMGVTDPIEDEELNEFIQKVNGDVSGRMDLNHYETEVDPKVKAALEEDLARLQNDGDIHFTPKKSPKKFDSPVKENSEKPEELQEKIESPQKKSPGKPEKENEKYTEEEEEPSEKSFNEYSFHNEITSMAEKIEASINRETTNNASPQKSQKSPSKVTVSSWKIPSPTQKQNSSQKASEIIPEVSEKWENTSEIIPERDFQKSDVILAELHSERINESILSNRPQTSPADFQKTQKAANLIEYLDNIEESSKKDLEITRSPEKSQTISKLDFTLEPEFNLPQASTSDAKCQLAGMEIELQECYTTIKALKNKNEKLKDAHLEDLKQCSKEIEQKLAGQKEEYENKIERHLAFVDQLVIEKKSMAEKLEAVLQDKVDWDSIITRREKELQDKFNIDMKKNKDMWMAGEKLRREKWMKEETQRLKELSIKGIEPEMERMIRNHKKALKQAKEKYIEDVNEEKLKLGQEYEEKFNDLKAKVIREKEDALERERERYESKLQQQYERIESQFNKERDRWNENMKQETERVESFRKRDLEIHKDETQSLKKQHQEEQLSLKRFYEGKVEKLEAANSEEITTLRSKLKEEYTEWREEFLQKQKDELREKLKEMRDQVKRERNEEINVIVNKLSSEAFDTEKALLAKFDRKEKEVEAKYRNEIMELKDRIESLRGKGDAERRTKEMLEDNLDITSKRIAENESEINQKNVMIESLRNSVKTLTEKLNSIQSSEQQERSRFERDEISKRSSLQREITMLREELESTKLKMQHQNRAELEIIEEKVKTQLHKKDEAISKLKDEVIMRETQLYKYKELLQKQRSQLLE